MLICSGSSTQWGTQTDAPPLWYFCWCWDLLRYKLPFPSSALRAGRGNTSTLCLAPSLGSWTPPPSIPHTLTSSHDGLTAALLRGRKLFSEKPVRRPIAPPVSRARACAMRTLVPPLSTPFRNSVAGWPGSAIAGDKEGRREPKARA